MISMFECNCLSVGLCASERKDCEEFNAQLL